MAAHDADQSSNLTQQDPDTLARLGGWLFTHRTSHPAAHRRWRCCSFPPRPLVCSLSTPLMLAWGAGRRRPASCCRLWAVHHIGVISRTRSDRLGPLIDTGPFCARPQPAVPRQHPAVGRLRRQRAAALARAGRRRCCSALEYHAIVRWEERLLDVAARRRLSRLHARASRAGFRASAPLSRRSRTRLSRAFSWAETLYSERGTLIAIVAGYVLLLVKSDGRDGL